MNGDISTIAVVGLGYVGLPLAAAFSKHFHVIGYDVNEEKLDLYKKGVDPTGEIGEAGLKECTILFTAEAEKIHEADFIVVAVPTPVNGDKTPDLRPVESSSSVVGRHMKKGAIVVYESTVYPGVTENICGPILEKESGLVLGKDFKIGYSPERINPGDKVHVLKNIVKIVSGMDEETLETIASVYSTIIEAGIYRAPNILVAEAAKLCENSQRDINIAFMNELSLVFHRMGIDTLEVVKAMNTKWNALGFTPGLVGGHCIGVDPYYFIYEAELLGFHSHVITAGRHINDGMSDFVAKSLIEELLKSHVDTRHANIYLLGMTFKENCPDTRNSRAIDIYRMLKEYGMHIYAVDPEADPVMIKREYGIELTPLSEVREADCVAVLVAHKEFRELSPDTLLSLYKNEKQREGALPVLLDIKGAYDASEMKKKGFDYWRL